MKLTKERPILMNAESVGGILDDRKTQTRRIIKPQPDYSILKQGVELEAHKCPVLGPVHLGRKEWGLYGKPYQPSAVPCFAYNCPYGKIGDRLWVRETWANLPELNPEKTLVYKATDWKGWLEYETETIKWKPSRFMFRKYSRILLEITDIRVERVQDIGEDCWKEGYDGNLELYFKSDYKHLSHPEIWFIDLWDSINAKPKPIEQDDEIVSYISYPWDDIHEVREHRGLKWVVCGNPWIWAVTFKIFKKEV